MGMRKPEESIYRKCLDELNVRAEEAVFLDDLGTNLKPAADLGVTTLKVKLTNLVVPNNAKITRLFYWWLHMNVLSCNPFITCR